jgi:uncharacterized damage-inducible protein DinB
MDLLSAWKFHQWATNRTLETCEILSPEEFTKDLGNSFSSVRDTLVHCLMADNAWAHRIRHAEFTRPDPKDFLSIAAIRSAWQPVQQHWAQLIVQHDPQEEIQYQAFDRAPYTNSFEEIARHAVNHGTYHRGQIMMMLRLLGHKAIATDWIAFSRLSRSQEQ